MSPRPRPRKPRKILYAALGAAALTPACGTPNGVVADSGPQVGVQCIDGGPRILGVCLVPETDGGPDAGSEPDGGP
jgi:hypothetical protein